MPVLQPEDLAFLLRNTDYKEEEIREWFRVFIMVMLSPSTYIYIYMYIFISLAFGPFFLISIYLSLCFFSIVYT